MKMLGTKPEMTTRPATTTVNNPVTDPAKLKCATKVDPRKAPNVTYLGRTYYFCSDADRAEFAKDPPRYFKGPGK
jgi:YHS domain-containing protein